ncbi:ABC transporter permease subunit [Microbacterium sp. CIAB417]|uniref:ABC transporter permease subunit n=1 Tax=Microbacterium sp. CIAB417 TaxID=2860287 RepID=UPI001FAD2ACE|nr:ABC transporter permease subunit [Microbacterium sp. CIAB417]
MRDSFLPVFRRSVRESWRGVLGWTIGLAAVLFLYLPLYPSLGGDGQLEEIISALPKELVETLGYDQISSGAGYAQSTFFGLMGFLLLTIAAVIWGSAAIAGSEENGRLELDLAHGIGRGQYALESALSVLVRLAWLGGFSGLVIWGLNSTAELELEAPHLVGAVAALTGLAFLTGSAALFAGAAAGRRAWATGAGAGIAVLGYILQALAKQSDDLEWLNALSPYAWVYHQPPLADGVHAGGLALTWGLALALCAASAVALRLRDLRG